MIEFTEDCLIGIEELDNEHRHLFDLINQGYELLECHGEGDSYDAIKNLLGELEQYADVHFKHEEQYMMDIHDQELVSQRVQHDIFRNRVSNWSFAEMDTAEHQRKLLEDIMVYMTKWLYNHIIGSDIMIGKLPPVEDWRLRENPCEFTDAYLVGIALIDEEHKQLFRIIRQVDELVRLGIVETDMEEIAKILEKLENYTKEHFRDEEEYMESIHYEGIDAQKRAHAAFIDRLDNLDFDEIKKSPQSNMEKLVEFLTQWLINHILYADKKIAEAVR